MSARRVRAAFSSTRVPVTAVRACPGRPPVRWAPLDLLTDGAHRQPDPPGASCRSGHCQAPVCYLRWGRHRLRWSAWRLSQQKRLATGGRPPPASELAERERDRNAAPDALRAVAMAGQPREVGFDLRSDPPAADPVDRRWLDEVLLQHRQLPLSR